MLEHMRKIHLLDSVRRSMDLRIIIDGVHLAFEHERA
jgi:hypothetical protein